MNNASKNDLDTVVITKTSSQSDTKTNKDYKVVKDVYSNHNKSKLDELPLWAKILISCILILVVIGVVIGSAFAIVAVNNMNATAPTILSDLF